MQWDPDYMLRGVELVETVSLLKHTLQKVILGLNNFSIKK